jgi:hypothetical protein
LKQLQPWPVKQFALYRKEIDQQPWRMDMKAKIASAVLALTIVLATAAAVGAACKVDHWTNGYDGHPIFKCDDGSITY